MDSNETARQSSSASSAAAPQHHFGAFSFDPGSGRLTRAGIDVHLPPRAIGVLRELLVRHGEACSKDQLAEAVWNGTAVTDDALMQAVSLLRQALGDDPRAPQYIRTVPGEGYQFVAAISDAATNPHLAGDSSGARSSAWVGWAAAVLVAIVVAVYAGWTMRQPLSTSAGLRFVLRPPEGVRLPSDLYREGLAISPDGRHVAYLGDRGDQRRIYVHSLDDFEPSAISGIESTGLRGAAGLTFSDDGEWLAFHQGRGYWRIPRSGGPSIGLVELAHAQGVAWLGDGTLLHRWDFGIWRRGTADEPERVGTGNFLWPDVMPDGRHFVANWIAFGTEMADDAGIWFVDAESGEQVELPVRGSAPRYSRSGHLLFARHGTLFAVRFDPEVGTVNGPPVPVLEGLATASDHATPSYAISHDGTLVYRPADGPTTYRVEFLGIDGTREVVLESDQRAYGDVRVSASGSHLALMSGESSGKLWLYDLERRSEQQVGSDFAFQPAWSPVGDDLYYQAWDERRHRFLMHARPGDLTGRALLESTNDPQNRLSAVWSVHPSGNLVAYSPLVRGGTEFDIWFLDVEHPAQPRPFLVESGDQLHGKFSPDGRWLAFLSDTSGTTELYLVDLPAAEQRWLVSAGGAGAPVWAPDGRTLYYKRPGRIMAVALDFTDGVTFSAPREVLEVELSAAHQGYDIHPDGERFAVAYASRAQPRHELRVIRNWHAELRRLVPNR